MYKHTMKVFFFFIYMYFTPTIMWILCNSLMISWWQNWGDHRLCIQTFIATHVTDRSISRTLFSPSNEKWKIRTYKGKLLIKGIFSSSLQFSLYRFNCIYKLFQYLIYPDTTKLAPINKSINQLSYHFYKQAIMKFELY